MTPEKSKGDNKDSKFNKIFQNKKTTYSKDYKEEQKDKIKNNYKKSNDVDYNEYTFGNEIKQDVTPKEKVIYRKPSSRKDDNDLISSSKKSIKRKIISDKNEIEDNITDKNSDGNNKKNKSKKHKKAKAQQSLLSFSMDDWWMNVMFVIYNKNNNIKYLFTNNIYTKFYTKINI